MALRHLRLLVNRDIKNLEYSATTQYRFHFYAAWGWFTALVVVPFVPTLWAHSVSALIIQEISLWSNFATHFGSMSSALAAKHQENNINQVKERINENG